MLGKSSAKFCDDVNKAWPLLPIDITQSHLFLNSQIALSTSQLLQDY